MPSVQTSLFKVFKAHTFVFWEKKIGFEILGKFWFNCVSRFKRKFEFISQALNYYAMYNKASLRKSLSSENWKREYFEKICIFLLRFWIFCMKSFSRSLRHAIVLKSQLKHSGEFLWQVFDGNNWILETFIEIKMLRMIFSTIF